MLLQSAKAHNVELEWTQIKRSCFVGTYRSSRSQIFFKKGVLNNFAILCWSIFLIKLQTWRPANLLKRKSNTYGVYFWTYQHYFLQIEGTPIHITKTSETFYLSRRETIMNPRDPNVGVDKVLHSWNFFISLVLCFYL